MSVRGLAVLGALLAALLVLVGLVDRPSSPRDPDRETLGALLPPELTGVRVLEVTRAGSGVRVERADDGVWKLVRPIEAEADAPQVEALFRALRAAKVRRVLEAKESDRDAFGLAPPAATLRVERSDGQATVTIEVGRESPMGGSRYASSGDGRLLLVEGLDAGILDRNAESLRRRPDPAAAPPPAKP